MTTLPRSIPNSPRRPAAPPTIGGIAAELEALLGELLSEHRELVRINEQHLRAISAADRNEIDRCAGMQQQAASRLGQLEARRSVIARQGLALVRQANPRFAGEVNTSAIAALCPEPQQARLLALAKDVHQIAEKTGSQHRTLKLAAATLAAHMQGLVEQVARALSHTGTYGRGAVAAYAPQVVSCLDMTS